MLHGIMCCLFCASCCEPLLAYALACILLQADLAAKYVVIFQNYGLDLEAVQKLYEKHKHAPPVVRNAPPVAGNIMWARQLLRRIEMPMKRYLHTFCLLLTMQPCGTDGP